MNTAGSGYEQIWACVGHNRQFAIQPGDVRIDTLIVEGPNAFQGGTDVPIDGVTEGDFRLWYDVRLGSGDGGPAADSLRLSNVFRVRTSETLAP